MSNNPLVGGVPRSSSRALLAITLALGTLPISAGALGQSRDITFNGELNYAAFRSAASRGETVTIRYSPGGTGAAALALARISKVVVDGACNSACAWSFVRNGNACFTPRASFGFHAAHDPGTGRRLNAATSYWLQNVRASLKGKLNALLSTSSLIKVSAAEMRRHYGDRVCGAEPRTEIASLDTSKRPSGKGELRTAKTSRPDAARSKARRIPASPDAVSVKADTIMVADLNTKWSVPRSLWGVGQSLSVKPELVAAVAMPLGKRTDFDGPVFDPQGALPELLASHGRPVADTAWEAQGPAIFANAGSAVVTVAARNPAPDEPPAARSLSLLYRPGTTFA